MAPPGPIPNPEVKHQHVDGSRTTGPARVDSCQGKRSPETEKVSGLHRLRAPARKYRPRRRRGYRPAKPDIVHTQCGYRYPRIRREQRKGIHRETPGGSCISPCSEKKFMPFLCGGIVFPDNGCGVWPCRIGNDIPGRARDDICAWRRRGAVTISRHGTLVPKGGAFPNECEIAELRATGKTKSGR